MSILNQDQSDYWNGEVGQRWAAYHQALDTAFAPFTEALFAGAALKPGERVLDIGCGAGDTALIAARQVGSGGHVTAADLSEPLLAVGRERVKGSGEYPRWLQSFVNSYQAIWGQPVVHEIPLVRAPTLFLMGGNDHNAPGKPYAPPDLAAQMGRNAENARALAGRMPNGRAEVFEGVGHLVHMEATDRFNARVLEFLDGH